MQHQLRNIVSLQEYKPSRSALNAALGDEEQVVPRARHMYSTVNQQPGSGSTFSGWKPPGNSNIPNQQPVQSWHNAGNNHRIH